MDISSSEIAEMRSSDPDMYMSFLESKISMLDAEIKHLKNLNEVTKKSLQAKLTKEETTSKALEAQVEKLEAELRAACVRSEQSDYDCDLLTNTNEQLRKRVDEQKSVIQQLTIALTKVISAQKESSEDIPKYIASAELLLNNLQQGISLSLTLSPISDNQTTGNATKGLSRFLNSFVNRFSRATSNTATTTPSETPEVSSPTTGPLPSHVNASLHAIVEEIGSIALSPYVPAEALIQLPSPAVPTDTSADNSTVLECVTSTDASIAESTMPSSGYLTVLAALNALNPITDGIYTQSDRDADDAEDADEEASDSSEDAVSSTLANRKVGKSLPGSSTPTFTAAAPLGLPLSTPSLYTRISGDHDRAQIERTARLLKDKHTMHAPSVLGLQSDGVAIVQKLDAETENKVFAAHSQADLQQKLQNERLFVSMYSKKVLDEFLKDEERRKRDFDVHVANLRDFVSKDPTLAAEEQPFLEHVNALYGNKRQLELEQRLNERMRSGLAKIIANPSVDNKIKEQALFLINRRTSLVAEEQPTPNGGDTVTSGNLSVKVVQAPPEEYLSSLPISRSELTSTMRKVEAEREKRLREEARQEILRAQRQKALNVPVERKGNDLYDYNGGFSPMRLVGAIGRTIDKAMEKYAN